MKRTLPLARRIQASVMIVLLVGALGILVGTLSLREIASRNQQMLKREVPAIELLLNIDRDAYQAQYALEASLLAISDKERTAQLNDFRENAQQTGDRWQQFRAHAINAPQEAALWQTYEQEQAVWLSLANRVAELSAQGTQTTTDQARSLLPDVRSHFSAMREALNQLEDTVYSPTIDRQSQEITALSTHRSFLMWIITVMALLIGLGVGWLVTRTVLRPLESLASAAAQITAGQVTAVQLPRYQAHDAIGRLVDQFKAMAQRISEVAEHAHAVGQGDLTRQVTTLGDDDLLGQSLLALTSALRDALGRVAALSESVAQAGLQVRQHVAEADMAVRQVADATQTVAHGSATQAARAREVAEAVEQVAETVNAVARAAQEQGRSLQRAVELSQLLAQGNQAIEAAAQHGLTASRANAEHAQQGQETVEQTVRDVVVVRERVEEAAKTVAELGERSRQIGKIVQTIEDLTEQTNLLALNAAIEAARAGEAGKGFAVVAEEVRKLAERSSEAAKEIAGLISGIQSMVQRVIDVMDTSAEQVTHAAEQAAGLRAVFTTLSTAAQHVAQQSQQTLEAARTIARQSQELRAALEETAAIAEENGAAALALASTVNRMSSSMQEVTHLVEQNASATEQVSAAAEEMTMQLQNIGIEAEHLTAIAEALQEAVRYFQTTSAAALQQTNPYVSHPADEVALNGHQVNRLVALASG